MMTVRYDGRWRQEWSNTMVQCGMDSAVAGQYGPSMALSMGRYGFSRVRG